MKFGTVRIHFLGEDFAAVAVEVASFFLFVCLFPARHLLVIVLNCMLILFASYFHEQLCCYSVLPGCWVWREVSFLL